jgi:hypothetical protein
MASGNANLDVFLTLPNGSLQPQVGQRGTNEHRQQDRQDHVSIKDSGHSEGQESQNDDGNMRSIQQQHAIFSPISGLNQLSFLTGHFRRRAREPFSHRHEDALNLLGHPGHGAVFAGYLLLLAQAPIEVDFPSGYSN